MPAPSARLSSSVLLDWALGICAAVMTLGEVLRFKSIIRYWNPDLLDYGAWYEQILRLGRWHALSGTFSSYNPPYIYVLALVSNLHPWHGPNTMVKLAMVPFILASAAIVYAICRTLDCSQRRSLLAGWVMLVAPEIIANALVWGQTDILETTFILLFALLLIRKHRFAAMIAGGIALSFKLQAVFIGPAVLALLLTGELPWLSLLGVPLGYALMMLPAQLEGRPLRAFFGAYTGQVQVPEKIAMGAANFYEFLMPWTGRVGYGPRVWWIDHLGIALAAVLTIVLIRFLVSCRPLLVPHRLLLALGAAAIAEPALLPKMHERYFFIGDILVLVAGVLLPRMFASAVLLQLTAILAYAPYLISFKPPTSYYILPFLMLTTALALVCRELKRGNVDVAQPAAIGERKTPSSSLSMS